MRTTPWSRFLRTHGAVKHLAALTTGAVLGALLVRERLARQAAERMAAAAFEALLNAIDANDPQTGAHVRRVAVYALILGDAADLDARTLRTIERVALFHDIGKIHEALFDIIHDPTRLDPAQRRLVATHPQRGADVLAPLRSFYPDLGSGVLSHHECWDGSGYPRGLAAEAIPLAARVVALADTFDALTHRRRYSAGMSAEDAARVIAEGRGTQFDPDLVDLMLLPPVWGCILEAYRSAQRPRTRRPGRAEHLVPDVTFRWRSKTVDPDAARLVGANSR